MEFRRRRRMDIDLDEDPFSLLVNFFDIAIVFALAFMVIALQSRSPGKEEAAPREEAVKLDRYRSTQETLKGSGQRLGTAYKLATGEVVYVPD